jgi:hypothetical protein
MAFLGPRANSEFVPKLQVALHALHVALPMVTKKFYLNVPLLDVGLKFVRIEPL